MLVLMYMNITVPKVKTKAELLKSTTMICEITRE